MADPFSLAMGLETGKGGEKEEGGEEGVGDTAPVEEEKEEGRRNHLAIRREAILWQFQLRMR